jgi:hypothetical protein
MAIRVFTHRPDLSKAPERILTEDEIKASEPNLAEMAINASKSLIISAASGFATVTDEQANERREICLSCQFWSPEGNLGLGKCRAPGCGCTYIKWKLATEKCPKGKWHSLQ